MLIPVTDPDPQLKKIGGLPEMIWFDNNFVPADSHELRLVKYHVVVNSIFLKKDTWIEAPGMILLIVLLIRRLMERSGSPPIFFVKDLWAYYRSFLFYVNLISFFGDIYIERGIFLKL
jgi:hypothetical protein